MTESKTESRSLPESVLQAIEDGPTPDESFNDEWQRRKLFANRIAQLAWEIALGKSSEIGLWISVGERLPDAYETVLLNCDGELRSTGFLTSDNKFKVDAEDPSDGSAWAVTHWMPLPESPK